MGARYVYRHIWMDRTTRATWEDVQIATAPTQTSMITIHMNSTNPSAPDVIGHTWPL